VFVSEFVPIFDDLGIVFGKAVYRSLKVYSLFFPFLPFGSDGVSYTFFLDFLFSPFLFLGSLSPIWCSVSEVLFGFCAFVRFLERPFKRKPTAARPCRSVKPRDARHNRVPFVWLFVWFLFRVETDNSSLSFSLPHSRVFCFLLRKMVSSRHPPRNPPTTHLFPPTIFFSGSFPLSSCSFGRCPSFSLLVL